MNPRQAVLTRLDQLGIPFAITEHPPVFTIEQMEALGITDRGEVCKNLFLRDDRGKRHFLVTLQKDKRADLALLREQLGTSRLGFASEGRLRRYLDLGQGEVTPLGLLNDTDSQVVMVLDKDLLPCDRLGVHPNENTATVWLSCADLIRFVQACGNPIRYVEL